MMVYFRKYEYTRESFVKFGLVALGIFFVIYPGIVQILPSLLDGEYKGAKSDLLPFIPALFIAAAVYGAWKTMQTGQKMLHIGCLSFLLIVLGYTTWGVLDMFVSAYGAEAGNLALKMLATGGVFVGSTCAATNDYSYACGTGGTRVRCFGMWSWPALRLKNYSKPAAPTRAACSSRQPRAAYGSNTRRDSISPPNTATPLAPCSPTPFGTTGIRTVKRARRFEPAPAASSAAP